MIKHFAQLLQMYPQNHHPPPFSSFQSLASFVWKIQISRMPQIMTNQARKNKRCDNMEGGNYLIEWNWLAAEKV